MDHDIIDGREPHSESDIVPEGGDDLDPQTGADDATDAEQIAEEAPRHIPGEVSEVLETGESAETAENTDIVENREPVEYDEAAEYDEAVEYRQAVEYDENADDAEFAEIAETVETGGPVGVSSDNTHSVEDDAHSVEPDEPRRTPVTPDNGYSRESYAIHATRSELPLFNDALNGGRSDLSWLSSLSSMLGGSKGPVGSAEGAAAVAHAAIDRRLATGKQADSAS